MPTWRATWFLLLWSVFCIPCARAQPIVLDVVPGFDGVCPAEGCYPVTVWIQGRRASSVPAVYEIEVTALSRSGSATARKAVTLAGEAVSQAVGLLLCSPEEPYEVTARLALRGRVLATSKPVLANVAQWYPLLVGLGEESSALAYVPLRPLGVVNVGGKLMVDVPRNPAPSPFLPGAGTNANRLFIGRMRNSLPPESAMAYRGVAAVSLDDRAWDTLTERQQQALRGYVFSGGLLVVHGVDINRLQSLMPSGLLPVEPLGMAQVPASALAKWIPPFSGLLAPVDVVRARPLSQARVLLQFEGIPLAVVASRGLGQVVFLAFDPSQPPFTSDEAAHSLWKNLLKLHVGRFAPPARVFPDGSFFPPSAFLEATGELYLRIVEAMVNAVAAKPVPIHWLVAYLGVYILVLIPLNYLILRRLDRLHLSWFTLPMLAALTSLAGYLLAEQVQTGSHQVRQWTVWYTTSGSPQATVESDWVLYSARTQHYRLKAKVDGILLENSPSDLQARRVAEIPQEEPAELRHVPIPLWSARIFHLSGTTSLAGSVNISAARQGKNVLRLEVHNNTPYALQNIRVVFPAGFVETKASCPPRGQASISVRVDASAFTLFGPTPMLGYPRQPPVEGWSSEDWHRLAMKSWLHLTGVRLSRTVDTGQSSWAVPRRLSPGDLSQGVFVAEVQGAPSVVEITPLPSSSIQQVTVLAVPFETEGGKR
ncbi:MAG: hypothetical protein KatS3mg023_2091 [Armatimonadota bacterium]|nr:MAG: hypothetical protein KatS3mg023_2091 [Armatimonadota bacterium]